MAQMAAAGSGNAIQVAGRAVCLLILLSACFTADISAAKYDVKDGRHNITMGNRRFYPNYPQDSLLFHDTPRLEGSWIPYPRVQSHDVCYPPKNSRSRRFTITAFNVSDMVPKGEGGYVFVTEGGVGRGHLCLHLKSQRGNGYHFNISVFGYYI